MSTSAVWAETELTPTDILRLGQFLERVRVVERRAQNRARQFAKPHDGVPLTDVLDALRAGVEGRPMVIAAHLGITNHLASVRLGRLRDQGLAWRDAEGIWRTVHPEPPG